MKNPKIFLLIFLSLLLNTYSYSQDFWELMDPHKNVKCIDIDQSGNLYIGAEDTLSNQAGLYKSTNGGESWEFLYASMYNHEPIAVHCKDDIVYFSNQYRLIRMTDQGLMFDTLYEGISNIRCILQGESGNIYFGSGALCRSVDNGQTWDTLLAPNPSVEFFYDIMEISPDSIYASSVNFITGGGVYRSVDGGESWVNILPDYSVTSLEQASNGDMFAAGYGSYSLVENQVMVSHDSGDTWESVYNSIGTGQIEDMTITPDDIIYIGLISGNVGAYFSDDYGVTWSQVESDIITNTSEVFVIKALPDGRLYTCVDSSAGITKLYRSSDTLYTEIPIISISRDELTAYPNPACDYINLSRQQNQAGGEVRISDVNGREVHKAYFTAEQTSIRCVVSSWPKGIYIARFFSQNKPQGNIKFLVM